MKLKKIFFKFISFIKGLVQRIPFIIVFIIFSILAILGQIVKFFGKLAIRKPIIFLLLIFGICGNSLPLPSEKSFTDDSITVLGQNQKLDSIEEYRALIGYGQSKILPAADFWDEYGSLDAWKSEKNVDLEPAIQSENIDQDINSSFDLFDGIKESDIPTGYDSRTELAFAKKLRAGYVSFLGLTSKNLPGLVKGTSRNLPGLEYAPGLKDDPNRDQQPFQDRRLLVRTEKRLNKRLSKANRGKMGLAIKNWQPFYHPHAQLRDKYYHAWVLDDNLPLKLSKNKLKNIQWMARDDAGYQKRLKILRDRKLISDQDVARLSGLLREHVIDPDTVVVRGTLGANREKRVDEERLTNPKISRVPRIHGYIVYNLKTQVASFYDLENRNLRTFMSISREKDQKDILENQNLN